MLRTALRGYDRRAVDAFLQRCTHSLGPRAAAVPGLPAPAAGPALPALDADDVRAARFPVVLLGYATSEVDALLDRVAGALPGDDARPRWSGPPVRAEQVGQQEALLSLHVGLRGYDTAEVDAFLVRCAHSLGPRVREVPELVGLLCRPRDGEPLRGRDVETVQFRVRARGYAIEQVDALLDRVAAVLDAPVSS